MSVQTAALLVVTLLLSLYGWLSGLLFSLGLARLKPAEKPHRSSRDPSPRWELAHVFLILGVAGWVLLFHRAVAGTLKAVLSTLVVGAVALLVQALLTMYIFYRRVKPGRHWANGLLALAALLAPLSFAAAGIVLITGSYFWQTHFGWTLIVAVLAGLLTVGAAFRRRPNSVKTVGALFIIWLVLLGLGLPYFAQHELTHLIGNSMNLLTTMLGGILLYVLADYVSDKHLRLLVPSLVITLVTALALVTANAPFLVYPTHTINQAYSQSAGPVVLPILVVVGLLSLGGFWWLIRTRTSIKPIHRVVSKP